MAGPNDAIIRLRFDTTGAESDLNALDRRVDQSARAAVRSVGGGGPGGGGGLLGSLLGAGVGGLTLAALGAQAAAPVVRDISTVTGGLLGTAGEALSSFMGLKSWANRVDAARQAQQDTIQAFGVAGAAASPDEIMRAFQSFKSLRDMEAAGRLGVENATRGAIAKEATDPVIALLTRIANALEKPLDSFSDWVVKKTGPDLWLGR